MRHKMHFLWIFSLAVMAGVTPAEGMPESWSFSSLLSLLDHADHGLHFGTDPSRSLSRHKRAATPVSEYIVDIEISFPDPSMTSQIKQFLATNLSLPWSLDSGNTNVTSIAVTTACSQTGSEVQCSCESGYIWPAEVCPSMYAPCPGTSNSSCSCIKGTTFPTQNCQLPLVNINLSLKMLLDFTDDLYNSASAKYKKFKEDLESQFNATYTSLPGFKSAAIKGFRPGSVIADYTVVTEPTTTEALSTANSNLIANLNSTSYKADSIRTEVSGRTTISVSPNSIFAQDNVTIRCTVNVTDSDASWYFNGLTKIQNNASFSITTAKTSDTIQSILTIFKVSADNSGTYKCSFDTNTSSYVAQATLSVLPMDLTVRNTVVPCDNTEVTIMQCCTTGGNPAFNLTCQKNSGNPIAIKLNQSPTCQLFTITANSETCNLGPTSSYTCDCQTGSGALQRKDVVVSYQVTYQINVVTQTEQISEWSPLTLVCSCSAKNVQSMSWNLIDTSGISNTINSNWATTSLANCNSTLMIPADSLSVSWNGTFQCLVNNGFLSENKVINVYRLAKPSQILRAPIQTGFKCGIQVNFSCCLDANIDAYKPTGTILQIFKANVLFKQLAMTKNNNCFNTSYTPSLPDGSCGNLTATCTITNTLGSTGNSEQMILRYVTDPKCSGNFGYGALSDLTTIPCENVYANQTGNITYICSMASGAAQWTESTKTCVSKVLNNLKDQIEELKSPGSETKVPTVLADLSSAVTNDKAGIVSSTNNIQLVINILQQVEGIVTNVNTTVMSDFLSTVSVVVDDSSTSTWNNVENKTSESSNLLQSVERFAEKLNVSSALNIANKNVQLKADVVSNLPTGYQADFSFSQGTNLTGNVAISKQYLNLVSPDAKVVSIAYPTLKDILGAAQNSTNNETVGGLVMTTILTNRSSDFSIVMDFKKSNSLLDRARCVYWNFTIQNWDDTGCKVQSFEGVNVSCVCNHLTSFSILMSTSEDNEGNIVLEYITYIGVGISMLSLVICIIIEATVWKSVTKNKTSYMRHVCIMNIAVTLLTADIWFIIGAAMNTTDKVKACVAATFFAHVFYLCVFFWMLTMGLILFYRLMCVFHDLSKTTMMGISFFLGYGCPIIIAVITVAVTQPSNTYLTSTACWLNIVQSKAFLAFILPALTILMVNFITLLVVIVKVLRPSVGDKPKKEEKSSLNHIAKCILILTPLLGLTWGFGIGTMSSSSVVIKGIFAALNSLQGLFILLFGCLMDKKVRDALFSRFSISRWSSQQTKTSNLSTTAEPPFSKGVINLFAKKGVYHISSAQMSSSSDMASSNSYSLLT